MKRKEKQTDVWDNVQTYIVFTFLLPFLEYSRNTAEELIHSGPNSSRDNVLSFSIFIHSYIYLSLLLLAPAHSFPSPHFYSFSIPLVLIWNIATLEFRKTHTHTHSHFTFIFGFPSLNEIYFYPFSLIVLSRSPVHVRKESQLSLSINFLPSLLKTSGVHSKYSLSENNILSPRSSIFLPLPLFILSLSFIFTLSHCSSFQMSEFITNPTDNYTLLLFILLFSSRPFHHPFFTLYLSISPPL